MENIQFDLTGRRQPDIAQTVYDTLSGQMIPSCQPDWVEDLFVPGHPSYEAYEQMQCAYARLRLRLGKTDEDADAEDMIDALLKYSRILGVEMFRCGTVYQKMLDAQR